MKFGEDEKFGDKDGSDQEIEKDKGKRWQWCGLKLYVMLIFVIHT